MKVQQLIKISLLFALCCLMHAYIAAQICGCDDGMYYNPEVEFVDEAYYSNDDSEPYDPVFDLSGLTYGINIGLYMPHRGTALFYNGAPDKENSIYDAIYYGDYVTNNTYLGRTSPMYLRIKESIGGYNFELSEYSITSKYTPTLNYGFFAKYNANNNLGLFMEFNIAQFKVVDGFIIELKNVPTAHVSAKKFQPCGINAREERFDINLGVNYVFGEPDYVQPFIEAAFNMNNTKVSSMEAQIGDVIFSYRNSENHYYNIPDGGVGFGAVVGGGVQVIFTESILITAGYSIGMRKINLDEPEKQAYRMNNVFMLRLAFRDFKSLEDIIR